MDKNVLIILCVYLTQADHDPSFLCDFIQVLTVIELNYQQFIDWLSSE